MRKPEGCRGCPMYGNGQGFVPDEIDPEAQVLAVSLAPTTFESLRGELGISAQALEYQDKYVAQARTAMSRSHVLRCRPQGVPLPTGRLLAQAREQCSQYDTTQEHALQVLIGLDTVKAVRPDVTKPAEWRGFLLAAPDVMQEDTGASGEGQEEIDSIFRKTS